MTQPIHRDAVYDSAEVARLVHKRSVAWFYTYRSTPKSGGMSLADLDGFPKPVSGRGHPRWLGADLIAWLIHPALAAAAALQDSTTVVDIRHRLRQRSRAIAGNRLAQRG